MAKKFNTTLNLDNLESLGDLLKEQKNNEKKRQKKKKAIKEQADEPLSNNEHNTVAKMGTAGTEGQPSGAEATEETHSQSKNKEDKNGTNRRKNPKKYNRKNKKHNLPVEQYQSMSIFKRLAYKGKVRDYDAVALALLARNLKKQHPEMSTEDILQNQIEFYLTIQKEAAKSARDLGDGEKRAEAIEHLQDFSKKKSAELVKTPVTRAINETIDDVYDYVYDFHMKLPKEFSQKEYSEKLKYVPKGLERKEVVGDNVSFSTPGFEDNQAFLHFALNVDLKPGLFDELVKFAEKYPCLYIAPKNLHTAYSKPDSLHIWILPSNQAEAKPLLQEIAKKHHRNRGDDLVVGKKITDGLFHVVENPEEYAKSVLTGTFNETTTQLNDIFENEQKQKEEKRKQREEEEKRKQEELKQKEEKREKELRTITEEKEKEKEKKKEKEKEEKKEVKIKANGKDKSQEPEQADVPPVAPPTNTPEEEPTEKPESNTPPVEREPTKKGQGDNLKKSKNSCVIDIGTNAVKYNCYIDGDYDEPQNKEIKRNGKEPDENSVVKSVVDFYNQAIEKGVEPKRVFIVATEGLRTSPKAEQIKAEILKKTGRAVHIISPQKEAFFSVYGGLKLLRNIEQRYVLFVESGGGSTEISVVDREKRGPSSILSTISLPLGSREAQIDGNEAKTQEFVAQNIKQLLNNLKDKDIDISSLGMVINSEIASRIMWKNNHKDGEKYLPKHVTQNHYGMSVTDFDQAVNNFILNMSTNKDVNADEEKIKDYAIKDETRLPGYIAHAQILKSIMTEVEKQFPDGIKNCQVLTTCGGLKEGLMKQIERLDNKGKSSEEIENELLVTDKPEDLPEVKEENDDFKKGWREFANKVAVVLNGKMEEDTQAKAFVAKVTTKETTTSITATSAHNVSLGAQKSDGSPDIPDQKVFDELALKSKDCGINFGDIKTPEFKARLMIACLKHNVEMSGQPKLDEEFLNSLDANGESAKYLKAWQNKQNTQQQQNKPTPQPQAQSNYEKTRDEREKMLELHSKTRTLTPQEQHELDYIRFTKKREQAFDEAIARTGDKDPRTAEHTKASGLHGENYTFHSQNHRRNNGWKLHLDVVPNRDDPTTKAVSEFLETVGVDHKIFNGGENGKGMTIFVGSYDDTIKLAKEINSRFGKDIAEPPLYTDQKGEEIDFNSKVTGRFYFSGAYLAHYPRGSIKGITPAESSVDEEMSNCLTAWAKQEKIIGNDYNNGIITSITRCNNFHDHYIFRNLETYCSHKLYQKHLGEFYCGKDADKFEKQIFGDALPPKGSKDRATWDKLADLYIQKSENDYPQGIQKMAELKSKYTPIDFNKVPPLVRPQKSNTGNQP